jgi:DNA (cytosine-5)-methyltransferase 1
MKAIELFAGAGGLGMGVSLAGFSPVKVIEWDRWCCDTIRENQSRGFELVKSWPLFEGDVREVEFSALADKVELVTGGPPCQPFSLGGKHQGRLDVRDMWPEAVRAIRETRPRAFIFENVKGLMRESFAGYRSYIVHQLTYPELVRHNDEDWVQHLRRLERHDTAHPKGGLSYQVSYRVVNAADYGIPQRRERVIFVGFRSDLGIDWSFPDQTHSMDSLLWDQERSGVYWERHGPATRERGVSARTRDRAARLKARPEKAAWRTVRDAIGDLPDPELQPKLSASVPNHKFQFGARSYPGHTGSPLDEPAKTLKAGVHGVPGGENMLAKPDGTVRYFSVRESARLQTFPDAYMFHGSWSETMRQLGNAVPVALAEILARDIHKRLSGQAAARHK